MLHGPEHTGEGSFTKKKKRKKLEEIKLFITLNLNLEDKKNFNILCNHTESMPKYFC